MWRKRELKTEKTQENGKNKVGNCENGENGGNGVKGGKGGKARRAARWLDLRMPRLLAVCAAAVGLMIACGFVCLSVAIFPDARGVKRVEIPGLCGSEYIAGELDGRLFDVTVEYEYSDDVRAGYVTEQYPPAGATRKVIAGKRPCALTLTVSRGRAKLILPSLSGLDAADAEKKLAGLGLASRRVGEWKSELEPGQVISTEPAAYSSIESGETVILYVNELTDSALVTVPELRGLSESEAAKRLAAAGLGIGKSNYVASDSPAGQVTAQNLAFGAKTAPGTKIYLTVSLGNGQKS